VVAEGHQRGEEFQNDRGVDKIDPVPYRVGDSIGARGRRGGRLGEGEFDFFLGEGNGGGASSQAAPAG